MPPRPNVKRCCRPRIHAVTINGGGAGAGGGGAAIPANPTQMPVSLTHNHEFVGPMVVDSAVVMADSGVSALTEVQILIRQTNDPDDQIIVTWGHGVSLPLGASQTFRAPDGAQLSTFTLTLQAGEAVNLSTQGYA